MLNWMIRKPSHPWLSRIANDAAKIAPWQHDLLPVPLKEVEPWQLLMMICGWFRRLLKQTEQIGTTWNNWSGLGKVWRGYSNNSPFGSFGSTTYCSWDIGWTRYYKSPNHPNHILMSAPVLARASSSRKLAASPCRCWFFWVLNWSHQKNLL